MSGIRINKESVSVSFPFASLIDEEILLNVSEPRVVSTTIRQALKMIAWRKMWRHAGEKIGDLKDKFVVAEVSIGEDGIVTVSFFHKFPKVPEEMPKLRGEK